METVFRMIIREELGKMTNDKERPKKNAEEETRIIRHKIKHNMLKMIRMEYATWIRREERNKEFPDAIEISSNEDEEGKMSSYEAKDKTITLKKIHKPS
jgi:hypothetical protein